MRHHRDAPMPSPFPGMDPYLEDPAIWPDFHNAYAGEIRAALNAVLPLPYYARLESRPEIGILGEDEGRPIVPDVSIIRRRNPPARVPTPGAVAVAEHPPRTERTESLRIGIPDEMIRHEYVEIRDATRGHALVTLIEIVSPSNKRAGADRRAYQAKQREVLDSDANLIEVDLLSTGEPVVASPQVIAALMAGQAGARYLVSVSRSWDRAPSPEYELFPFGLYDSLPCIGVPLREGEDEVLLDLQYVLRRVYDTGPYARGAIDYDRPPAVSLNDEEQAWVRAHVAAAHPGLPETSP